MATTVSSSDNPASSSGDHDDCDDSPDDEPAHPSNHCLEIEINLATKDTHPPLLGWLDRQLHRVAAEAGVHKGSLSIRIVSDNEMSRLHKQHLDDDATTDVITFDLRADPTKPWQHGDALEGDLAICLDQAVRVSSSLRDHRSETRLEVLLYAVHGLLHLMGMDDNSAAAAAAMHEKEDRLLSSIGIGPVYHRPCDP